MPECTLTGYLYKEEDLERFAEPIPGPTTARMRELVRRYRVFLCFGLLEVAGSRYYDSAVLLDREGRIVLHHRKIEEHPPFTLGEEVKAVDTELGRLSVVICGDLFNDDVVGQIDRSVDLLLVRSRAPSTGRPPIRSAGSARSGRSIWMGSRPSG